MIKNLKLLIFGGDSRQIEVAKMAAAKGTEVMLVGFDQASDEDIQKWKMTVSDVDFSQVDAMLLPVSGVDDDGKVHASFSDGDLFLTKEFFQSTPERCVIYTGIETPYLKQLISSTNRKLVPLFVRDDLAILNSIPTAEGVLKLAIEHTEFMLHGSKVMVLGYGRVGKTIARIFSGVGANVTVASKHHDEMARVLECGLTPIHLKELENEVRTVDICINTIPHLILTPAVLTNMSQNALIIDVASKPGGTDFQYAEKIGLKTLWALGLPGKVAPKSAGEIIGKVVVGLLEEDF
ncbi:dipicolinate synthase subunit DpsA [Bacillus dakarensis]|uniref:dipicolinate synthase subunit DpsA n=1 Tax=Robertmurraya dakarensis TaxID=1926278 RepID=UPI000980AABB|nr:dipicolinate synthase subunit DpsA [Bacillus dakarensis]